MPSTLPERTALFLSLLGLALTAAALLLSRQNRALQAQLQQQVVQVQSEIRTANETESVSRSILPVLGQVAATNEQIRALLASHGYTLSSAAESGVKEQP